MSELTQADKDLLYRRVQGRMRRWYGETAMLNGMACLYWMHAGVVTLLHHNVHAVCAAGSAHWQCQPDDGKMSHFGFEWGGDPEHELRRQVILSGGSIGLPEMHCWIWLPHTQEIVDFSAGHVPTLAKAMGFEWQAELVPPGYIWARVQSLFPRAVYIPNRDATQLAVVKLLAGQKGTQ